MKFSFQQVLIHPKRIPNKKVTPILLWHCNLSRAVFRTRNTQYLCHNSLYRSSKLLILDALESRLNGASKYLIFFYCASLNRYSEWMDTAAFVLKFGDVDNLACNSLGTTPLHIIWVSCPAWLVKYTFSPNMCSFKVINLTKRKARSRFAKFIVNICIHNLHHNQIVATNQGVTKRTICVLHST